MRLQDIAVISEAELQLAILYLYGDGVDRNEYLAVKFLEKSALKGNSKAECLLMSLKRSMMKTDSLFYPKNLIHKTANGISVRSKSEVIIANALFYQGIEFTYEQDFTLKNGKKLSPDFTIHCYNGRILIWEHLGLLSNKSYLKKWNYKKYEYERNGFIEGDNLLVTIDEDDGSIDSESVFKLAAKVKNLVNKI